MLESIKFYSLIISTMKVLIVDDEKILSSNISKKLEQSGYHTDVANSISQYKKLDPKMYGTFIIDISLGDGSGLDIVKELRNDYKISVPIIIISWHESTTLKIQWLDIGADDYITKPVAPDELMARIRSVMRREWQWWDTSSIKSYKDITFDLATRKVMKADVEVNFTRKEKQIVEFFLFRKNELISKRQLVQALWNTDDYDYVTDNTINVTIYKVRKKLGSDFKLETKIGEGYILEE